MKRWTVFVMAIAIISFSIGYLISVKTKWRLLISDNTLETDYSSNTVFGNKTNNEILSKESTNVIDNENYSDFVSGYDTENAIVSSSGIDYASDSVDSLLPGHNTYINGFKRLTKLTYDDVATVTDSKYSFTIGTFYDDEYYHEPLESCGHVGGGFVENGCFCKWAYAYYKDLEVGYTTYNCINRDYSGKHEYIGEIRLVTPRFKTKAGLHVGSSVQDVFDAYPKDIDKTPSEEGGDPCYELYIDGVLTKFFYDEDTQKITSIKLSY